MLTADRIFLLKTGMLLASGEISEAAVDSACEAIRKHTAPIDNRFGYFFTVLDDEVSKAGGRLKQLLAGINVPDEFHESRKPAAGGVPCRS